MSQQKFRVFKLRTLKEEELTKNLTGLKEELQQLRTSKIAGGTASKLGRIRLVRKRIAKYLTVINQQRRASVRKGAEKKNNRVSLLPLDLRGKKTRAIRRRLSKSNLRQKTLRQWKDEKNFPLRKFALKN